MKRLLILIIVLLFSCENTITHRYIVSVKSNCSTLPLYVYSEVYYQEGSYVQIGNTVFRSNFFILKDNIVFFGNDTIIGELHVTKGKITKVLE